MNYLAQLYGNLGAQQYQPLSSGWLGQYRQTTTGPASSPGRNIGGPGFTPIVGGSYDLGSPTYANTNWLGGLNQAWNSGAGRALSSALGLGQLRAGSNFLEGLTAASGGIGTGVVNALSQMFGGAPSDAVQRQRDFDAAVALESQDMINRGINPDTGRPFDAQAQADARAQRDAERRNSLMRNAMLNSEIASAQRVAQYNDILASRRGAQQER